MAIQVTVLRLTLCAPSDVVDEIAIATRVIDEWNLQHGLARNLFVKSQHWKTDGYPEAGDRPQALFNRQLIDDADILVAIFWSKFGSPTGIADSGTEEEIRRGIEAKKKVMVYFSARDIPACPRDEKQLEKIAAFKADFKDRGIYWVYGSLETFGRDFTRHLTAHLNNFQATIEKPKKARTSRKKAPVATTIQTVTGDGNSVAGRDLIHTEKVVQKIVTQPGPQHISEEQAYEVKRLIDELAQIDVDSGRPDSHKTWFSWLYRRFRVTSYKTIPIEKYDAVMSWLRQQKAINRKKLRRPANELWWDELFGAIHGRWRQLGNPKDTIYDFVFQRLELDEPIASLKELGEQDLKRLYDIVIRLR